jgi:hypothetical protein
VVLPGKSQVPAQCNGSRMNSRFEGLELSALTRERLVEVGSALAAADIEFELRSAWTPPDTKQLCSANAGVTAVLAGALPDMPDAGTHPGQSVSVPPVSVPPVTVPPVTVPPVTVHLADMHVLDDENQRVERFAAGLPVPAQVACSLSFADPIMEACAKDWVKPMMIRLGLKSDEPIESPMVYRGLRRAMQKLAKNAIGNELCDSLQEWMGRNLPK